MMFDDNGKRKRTQKLLIQSPKLKDYLVIKQKSKVTIRNVQQRFNVLCVFVHIACINIYSCFNFLLQNH